MKDPLGLPFNETNEISDNLCTVYQWKDRLGLSHDETDEIIGLNETTEITLRDWPGPKRRRDFFYFSSSLLSASYMYLSFLIPIFHCLRIILVPPKPASETLIDHVSSLALISFFGQRLVQ